VSQLGVIWRGFSALAVRGDVIDSAVFKGMNLIPADLAGWVTLKELSPELEREKTRLEGSCLELQAVSYV
jgi:hypothetical protein